MRVPAAFSHRFVVFLLTVTATTRLLAAPMNFVHRGPRTALGLFLGNAVALIPFFYVLSLAFLFVSVFRFVTAWHFSLLFGCVPVVQTAYREERLARGCHG